LKYKKDIDIQKANIIEILNSNNTKMYIYDSYFIENSKIFLSKFFKFNEKYYRNKVMQYLIQFITKLENWEFESNNISNELLFQQYLERDL